MKTKFIFLSLKIVNGEYEYSSYSVHEIPKRKKPETFAREYVKDFYGDRPKPYQMTKGADEYWYFNGGEVAVRWKTVEEITKEQYDTLSWMLSK